MPRTFYVATSQFPKDGIEPTKLYCTNKDVNQENSKRLDSLPGRAVLLEAKVIAKGSLTRQQREQCEKLLDAKIRQTVALKVGAQVMCLKNYIPQGLVNGSRGVVVSFDEKGNPVIRWTTGKQDAMTKREDFFQSAGGSSGIKRVQIPLKLAW